MNGIQYGVPVSGADPIVQLPADQTQPSHNEIRLVESLFKENKSTIDVIAGESKDIVLIACLFILFSLPQVSTMMEKFVPIMVNSIYISVLIRAVCVVVLYWLIKNFYLSRKA